MGKVYLTVRRIVGLRHKLQASCAACPTRNTCPRTRDRSNRDGPVGAAGRPRGIEPFTFRHPVLTTLGVLFVLGVVVRWWWVLLTIGAVVGVVVLVAQGRRRRHEVQVAAFTAQATAQRAALTATWTSLSPDDREWLRRQDPTEP